MIEAVTTSPLFGIVLCIGTFQIGRWVQKKTGHVGDEKIGFFFDVVGAKQLCGKQEEQQHHTDDAGGEGDGKQRRDALAYQAYRKYDADLCHDTHCKNSFGIFTKRTVIIIAQY